MRARVRRLVSMTAVVLALAVSVVSCGSSGEDATESALPPTPVTFHPCEGFGPDAQSAAGIGGKEPTRYPDREVPFQARECSFEFNEREASLLISSNAIELSRAESDERFTMLEDTEIDGHRTLLNDFPGGLQCVASVDFDPGVLEVMVGYKQLELETADEACPMALQVARDLAPYFPEHL